MTSGLIEQNMMKRDKLISFLSKNYGLENLIFGLVENEIMRLEQMNSVLIEKYTFEVKEITFGPIKKNILLKNKLMEKKFGLFKSIVYRTMQYRSFVKFLNYIDQSKTLFNGITHIIHMYNILLLEYIETTTDIWFPTRSACRVKVFDIYGYEKTYDKDSPYAKYLVNFGFVCPYPKSDDIICGKKCSLCSEHKKCVMNLKKSICDSLPKLLPELSNIVFEYALPYVKI